MDVWVDRELDGCHFPDVRLKSRMDKLLKSLGDKIGDSLPTACQDWAATKGAYRFIDNERVSETEILGGHFQATRERLASAEGPILVLHDTTEFSYTRSDTQAIGKTHKVARGQKDSKGRQRMHTVCGLLMHSSLVVTPEGLPLGLAAIKLWTRKKFKGLNALMGRGPDVSSKHSVNTTRIPIEKKESVRWLENVRQSTELLGDTKRCIHIGDRESDIYELFGECESLGTQFVFRTCVDRRSGDGEQTAAKTMRRQPIKAVHRVEVLDAKGQTSTAVLELKYLRLPVCPPIGKEKRYAGMTLIVIHATERGKPKHREPIQWKLITNLPVASKAAAVEKLDWYAMRWKIETFHKILKSGCRAEESKLRTAERLANLIALLCILAWRVLWLTMVNRLSPELPARLVFTDTEMKFLARLVPMKTDARKKTVGPSRATSKARRLPRPHTRLAAGQHGDLARHGASDRHSPWLQLGAKCG
ncbi:Transposase for transposon Tn5 [Anatilimnocola aggregata]|uniref:Transposase for transposon Tn5 n=1 Tax=Anatilimnocola aggregata TaxID=2528021 RepID=A0A517YBW2_9BACT|nr:IS4 family transposase [Anatilimnocola aggregata]QDU27743.1 Transposase for transposon Tn5 [Anatilimnocola aggregata]